jgi:EpsI family protein
VLEADFSAIRSGRLKTNWRFVSIAILLAVVGVVLHARNTPESIPVRTPLSSFPHDLGGWTSRDIMLDQQTRDVLGPGDFMERRYWHNDGNAPVDLFIAYFPSQRAGATIHSPKNCLPGSGWFPVQADRVTINAPGHSPFHANRYLIAKGDDRELVLYWYWAHDRAVASEYAAKIYLVTDAIRMNRTDGSLIRVSIPVEPHQSLESAQSRLLAFTSEIIPRIDAYVPR